VRREIIWRCKLVYLSFVRAALKGRHMPSPGYNPGVEMNEIKQRPAGAQYKT